MKEKGDFIRNRETGKVYWIEDIDYKNRIYVLEHVIKMGNGLEDDEKEIVGFDFDEVAENFEEESIKKRG